MHMYVCVVTCIIVIVLDLITVHVVIISCLVTMVFVKECLLVFRVSWSRVSLKSFCSEVIVICCKLVPDYTLHA